jgi:ABC-type sugar transport system ATPase subunit
MAKVALRSIDKYYGSTQVLFDVSLEIESGEFVVFVGPSGCGKSTLLRAIAGLEDISSGQIEINGRVVNQVSPSHREVAMVFQSYALYPHMSVRANMEFGLKVNKVPPSERVARIEKTAEILQLEEYLERKPGQLSGGQRQRVAIGRAIVKNPQVFLFDEPLSNLDAALRVQMRVELDRLHSTLGTTMIYVTHDQVEAMTLADRIVVLNDGRVEQIGAPMDLYHRPQTLFVAGFIGSPKMNFLPVVATGEEGGNVLLSYGDTSLPCNGCDISDKEHVTSELTLGVRPEHLRLAPLEEAHLRGTVTIIEALGNETNIYTELPDGRQLVVRTKENTNLKRGDTIGLYIEPGHEHLFNRTGRVLNHPA